MDIIRAAREPAFRPRVEVFSPEPETPAAPEMSLSAILERFPGIAEADAIGWTGSTAAGWGNPLSDIDLYVISDKQLELPADETVETWTTSDDSTGLTWFSWMGRWKDTLVDLKVLPTNALPVILAPYLPPGEPEFCGLAVDTQDIIYRHAIAVPFKNKDFFDQARKLIDGSSYRRSVARNLKNRAENRFTDIAGQLLAGDALTARFAATLAACAVAEQCLVLAGDLCPSQKWLMRRLAATPACGITADEYRAEVLDGARPGESDADCALRIARWAQHHMVRVESAALGFR